MTRPCLRLTQDGSRLAIPLGSLAYGATATVTKILIRLQTQRRYWTEDDIVGIDWLGIGPGTTTVEIEGLVRQQVIAVPDVVEIVQLNVEKIGDQVSILIHVKIQDANGVVLVEIGALSTAGNYPETWYNLLGVDFAQEC